MGNRTAENTFDPTGSLRRTHSRVFNLLGQLWKDVNAAGTVAVTTEYGYDNNGNQTSINAPLSRSTTSVYDELNRVTSITGPGSVVTTFAYDANDNLTSVTDPRSLVTSYAYSGIGDFRTQTSPDTGVTTNTYDSGGNLKTSVDARGVTTTYVYDALNRVTSAAFKLGSTTDQTITYTYDQGTNGKGRMTGASDARHSMAWAYDSRGRMTSASQTFKAVTPNITQTIGLSYNAQGQLFQRILPSGRTIQYGYDSNSRLVSITLIGSPNVALVSNISYDPFGPVKGWTWSNGSTTARSFDSDGKLTGIGNSVPAVGNRGFGFDDAFRITSTTDSATSGPAWTLGYDSLDRLNAASKTGFTIGYAYDANGNRLSQTGTAATTYSVSASSNRLSSTSGALSRSYTYDAAGNTHNSGATAHTYNNRGRMKTARLTSTTTNTNYDYNALGQRMRKGGGTPGTVYFAYDEAGHLVGEYNSSGVLIQETIWLGDIPVATLRPNGTNVTVFYVHTDQLNTPRKITNTSNQLRWKWDPNPFGEGAPNENPASLGAFKYNLRFPGQLFDMESNLNYNYFRTYDAAVGRFVESDPIGLNGGINPYAYAGANAIMQFDPLGLACKSINGRTHCSHPGGPTFVLPTPEGWKDFDGSEISHHDYHVRRKLGCADGDSVMRALIEHPTNSQQARPATTEGTTKNDASVGPIPNLVTSYLTSDVQTGRPLVVNITAPGSAFGPGYVVRAVSSGFAHTYGEGISWTQFENIVPAWIMQGRMNDRIWGDHMEKMIENCGCR